MTMLSGCLRALRLLGVLVLAAAPSRTQGACFWEGAAEAPVKQLEAPSLVIDGKLHVFGGFLAGLVPTLEVHVYDPIVDAWSRRADMPEALTHVGMARDDRQVWMAGGFLGKNPGLVVDRVWVYDVDLDRWQAGPALPAPRGSGGLFRILRGLHFVGGVSSDRNTDQPDHWVLDLDDPTSWSVAAPLPSPRNHFSTVTLGDRGYVIGGQNRHDTSPIDVDLVHAWDPQSGWSQLASLPFPRSHAESGTFLLDGRIAIAGGRANTMGLPSVADVSVYDPTTDQWSPLTVLPGPLLGAAAKVVGSTLVVSGGGPTPAQQQAATHRRPVQTAYIGHLRVNSGGGALALAETWCGDVAYTGGKPSTNSQVGNIAGTDDDELYRSERTSTTSDPKHFAYSVAAPPGEYIVRLHFAEIFFGAPGGVAGAPGKRVFDVALEGQLVLDDLDLFVDPGPATAAMHTFHVGLADGALDVDFTSSVNRPTVAGYEIVPVTRDGAYCTAAPNSTGSGARIGWSGTPAVHENQFALATTGLPAAAKGIYLQSQTQAQAPFASGILCVGPKIYRIGGAQQTDASGVILADLDLAHPSPLAAAIHPGATWNFQFWYRDTALATSNLSDGLALTFLP
jgi:hypothetical protein